VEELSSKITMGDIVHAKAPDVDIHPEECLGVFGSDPFTIVIMGATGDLTARKLVPALFNLYLNKGLPKFFQIVGCGRTKLDDQQRTGTSAKSVRVAYVSRCDSLFSRGL